MTSIDIPSSVTFIGDYAFKNCSGLTSITIPTGVTSIGVYAFYYCSGLTSVIIPNSVTSIGGKAFLDCISLTSVTIPNSVISIGDNAFYGCSGLTSVTIGNSVTSIGDHAFHGCSGLTSVSIPNSVISIGKYAFYGCSGLTSVTIGNSVASIGDHAFHGCSGLTSVSIPNGVTSIGKYAFGGCNGLTSVTIGTGVTSIGDNAFSGCSGLTSVTIPNSVTSIGEFAFYGCSGLTSISIPNSVTSIGRLAFSSCSSLTSVSIPIGVTSIGWGAFAGCSALTSVTIGNSVTSIGDYAFSECSVLTSVRCSAVTPPSIDNTSFLNALSTCTLTVPCGSIDVYIGSDWNTFFAERISEDTPFELNASSNDTAFGTVAVSAGASCPEKILTATPASCYHFTAWNDGNTDNPRTITVTQDTTFTANFTKNIYTGTIQATICSNETYDFNGRILSTSGAYTDTLQTVNGCDSIVTLNLTVNPVASTNLTAAICEGSSYTENGFNASEAGTYTQNLQTIDGCDSIVTLTLSVNPVASTTLSASICEGTTYTENGFNASEAGTYTQNMQTVNGCDSIVTLTLTVNPVANTTLSVAICEGTTYTENGFNASETGTYTQTLQTVNGCDSIVTLNLIINPVASTNLTAAICEGSTYTENGFNVSEAGTYTQNLQTVNGCDSIVTLTLTVNPVESTNLTAAICEGSAYAENGFNVSEAGTYTQNLQTIDGCDSIVTLTLTVNPVANTTLSAAICEGTTYTENGFNVSEAGTYTQNLQTVNGCDSIVTLTLAVNPVESTNLTAAICEGSTYTENGFNESETGIYTQNLQTVNGCDSIVTLTLAVNPVANTNLTAAICEGSTYTENGFNESETGIYTQNLQTVNGCDSVVTLTLTVNPTYNITIDASINEGETYEENGFSESEAGTYVHTLQAENGCDSVITLNLTVNLSLVDVVANAVEISLYPNPTRAYTTLKVEDLKEQTPVYLLDIQGRKLREYVLNAAQQTLKIDLGDLPKGVYTVILGNTTKKLIVE